MNTTRIYNHDREAQEKEKKRLGSKEYLDSLKTTVRHYKPKDKTKKTVKHSKEDLHEAAKHMKLHGG